MNNWFSDFSSRDIHRFHPLQPGFERNFCLYNEIKPIQSEISDYVMFYYEMKTALQELHSIPVLPDGCMDIVFIQNENDYHLYILGTAKSLVGACSGKNSYILGARFVPGGIYPFFSDISQQCSSLQIPLDSIYPNSNVLAQAIFQTKTFQDRVQILEQFLQHSYRNKSNKSKLISYCIDRLIETRGALTVQQLGAETAFSTRYINQIFQMLVGLSPRQFCDIMRIQDSVRYIISGTYSTLADISAQSGYYDQSHMNRKYYKFLNCNASYLKGENFFKANHNRLNEVYSFK